MLMNDDGQGLNSAHLLARYALVGNAHWLGVTILDRGHCVAELAELQTCPIGNRGVS